MSTTVCSYNYEYNGQIYSPAFSDPPSPKEYNYDSEEDGCLIETSSLSPPLSPVRQKSSKTDVGVSSNRLEELSFHESTSINNNTSIGLPSTKDLWKNNLKRKNPDVELNSESFISNKNLNGLLPFVNKKPKFPTKYHEMLQPLSPATSYPPATTTEFNSLNVKQRPETDVQLQEQLNCLIDDIISSSDEGIPSSTSKVEEFLLKHSEKVDLNRYNSEGQTILQRCCLEGNLSLAKLVVRFGAKSKITTRDGFTTLHIAAFSCHSQMLFFVLNLKS